MTENKLSVSFASKTALVSLMMLLLTVGYTMLLFALKIPMSAYNAIVPVAGIAIYSVVYDRQILIALLINLAILAIWTSICTKIFDWSYDGMYYHKQAAITLAEGWNPLYQSSTAAEPLNHNADLQLWLDHYPKGLWICSAAMYIVTGSLESAKAINILFLVMLFGIAYNTLRTVFALHIKKSALFSFIACINPVFISQLLTSYNDFAVGILIISAAFIGMKIYAESATQNDYALLFCITAMSCIVKFTAPLLVGLVLIAYGVGYLIKTKAKSIVKNFKKPLIVILAGFIAGTVFFGFAPYVKHIASGQNLVYPVLGENKYDIMNTNPPKGFYNKPEFLKYFLSLFSETNNDKEQKYSLKIPFTFSKDEFTYLSNADIRLGGFGIFFSGILTVSSVLAIFVAVKLKQKMRYELLIGIITFPALGLFFPEAWWARYASYTFYIPVFLLLFTIGTIRVKNAWKIRLISAATVFLIFINSLISFIFVIKDANAMTDYLYTMLDEIKAENKKIEIRINDFPSHLKLFEEKGIEFEVADTSIPDAITFYADTKYRFLD